MFYSFSLICNAFSYFYVSFVILPGGLGDCKISYSATVLKHLYQSTPMMERKWSC